MPPPPDTNQYKKFFQAMKLPRFIVEPKGDDKFVISFANDLALKYFNRSDEQVRGARIDECMDHENALHFQQSFEVVLFRKRAVTIQTVPGVPGNLHVYGFYVTPILDENGEIEFLDVVGQMDIADQSILQRERDDAISLLTSIFDVSEVGIIVTDHKHHIIRVNESFIRTYGWARDELINKNFSGLVTADEIDEIKKNYDECIQTGQHASGEMKIIRKGGSVANALFTTATMELSQSRRFQITTVMDITLRKQMEQSLYVAKEQADAANRSKSLFLANMSHELRTPLNAIIGFSEMMIQNTFGPLGHPKYSEYLGDVHSSANHLLKIINEVLDMSKIEAGKIDLDESSINISDLVISVIRMLDSKAFGSNIKFKTHYDKDLPTLYADHRLVRQILINLAGNALKFSKAGDTIHIEAKKLPSSQIQITVSDQGIGIPQDKIQEALEPFKQISSFGDNSFSEGTGLGLPLSKAMLDLHGGTLDIKSTLGKGTTIEITFPASRTQEKKDIAEPD